MASVPPIPPTTCRRWRRRSSAIDTPRCAGREPWGGSHDPYVGTIENGRLHGRGAAEMKTGLAVAMRAAVDLAPERRDGNPLGSVVVHAAIGEEAGEPRTRSLLEAATDAREFVSRGTPAIVWGPGSLDPAHTVDEWIDLDGAARCLEVTTAGLRETLAGGV